MEDTAHSFPQSIGARQRMNIFISLEENWLSRCNSLINIVPCNLKERTTKMMVDEQETQNSPQRVAIWRIPTMWPTFPVPSLEILILYMVIKALKRKVL